MRLGMLHLFENPSGRTEHEIVKEQFELINVSVPSGTSFGKFSNPEAGNSNLRELNAKRLSAPRCKSNFGNSNGGKSRRRRRRRLKLPQSQK